MERRGECVHVPVHIRLCNDVFLGGGGSLIRERVSVRERNV